MVPVPAAYLRVYEPMSSFDAQEGRVWEEYLSRNEHALATKGRAPGARVVGMTEAVALAPALVRPAAVADVELDEAFFLAEDGVTYVCPWRSGLRAWEALVSFRAGVPDPLAEAICPDVVAERVEAELAAYRRLHPGARTHVLSSAWSVPIRWFVCFEPVERTVVLRPPEFRALWYRSTMSRVRRRVGRATSVVREAFGDGGPAAEVEALDRWLDQFHPHSLVELDYGTIVEAMTDEAMREDDSAGDVMDSLDGLATGDGERAGRAYERVVGRWRPLAALERAS